MRTSGDGTPRLVGTVVGSGSNWLSILVEEPAPGTAIIAAEGHGEQIGVSVWSYLYGEAGEAAADDEGPRWWAWLARPTNI